MTIGNVVTMLFYALAMSPGYQHLLQPMLLLGNPHTLTIVVGFLEHKSVSRTMQLLLLALNVTQEIFYSYEFLILKMMISTLTPVLSLNFNLPQLSNVRFSEDPIFVQVLGKRPQPRRVVLITNDGQTFKGSSHCHQIALNQPKTLLFLFFFNIVCRTSKLCHAIHSKKKKLDCFSLEIVGSLEKRCPCSLNVHDYLNIYTMSKMSN